MKAPFLLLKKEVITMGFFEKWLLKKGDTQQQKDIVCVDLSIAAAECAFRFMAIETCINMIANAIGNCEFKTFSKGKEVKGREYYTWNVEPNINQNSSDFIHKLISKLCKENEALIVSVLHQDGHEMLYVADSWSKGDLYPTRQQEYHDVYVGEKRFFRLKENEVMHLTFNGKDIKKLLDMAMISYDHMLNLAQSAYTWANGKHIKVHVDGMASGEKDFSKKFSNMLADQVKPFFNSPMAVLPEFDGYKYEYFGNDPDSKKETRDIKALADDIFSFTARAFNIPPVLILGDVADTENAFKRWLTVSIDPLASQLQEEGNRKRYGYERWKHGDFMHVDTSTVIHFDLFSNAANIEKLIGSGCYSINDILIAAGRPPVDAEWANQHWLTLNIGTMEKAAQSLSEGGETE